MTVYLMPVMGQLREPADSAFSYVSCSVCHASNRSQIRDLQLEACEEIGAFSTTIDGDFMVESHVAKAISLLEPSVDLRAAIVEGVESEWFQVVPLNCVELSEDSLRTPREHCEACGGVARVQFASYPPLRIATSRTDTSHIATICGAPLMTVISGEIHSILSEFDSAFHADEVLFVEA